MKFCQCLCLLLLLQGCSEEVTTAEQQPPLVIQTFSVIEQPNKEIYEFPAVVSAVKTVELKFEVSGRLIETDLVKGKKVKKGQVLARIDPAPYQRKVKDRQVRHDVAAKELVRIRSLFKKGGVSQSILDNAESLFETTLLDLNNAKQDLSYCNVSAPFDAFVSDRYKENDSYVQVGNSVATLQDRSSLYFSFDVPERVMTANTGNKKVQASAKLVGLKNKVFDIHYVEHEATPDPITQTYNVTFAINDAQETDITPGSRAIVTVLTSLPKEQALIVPLAAVSGDAKSGFIVWLFDANSSTVKQQAVAVSGIAENYALVSKGLTVGDKVVAAGITKMRAGLTVREYKGEQ
ncbi:efflux RND transporter periplasmic adaptor subunit [Thalassotalea sp. PLHSN55]|uniref:efflux RND transporter periplasmic adaptor subunit n=1 Tax=Thalassotalea sp. PLHSN55 TaxID=3435888 RepID=UPI003F87DAAC